MRYVLVIDIGTGSSRATCFTHKGKVVAHESHDSYQPSTLLDDVCPTFDPATTWSHVSDCVRRVISVAGVTDTDEVVVTATSVREGFVLYDRSYSEIWGFSNVDPQASAEVESLLASGEGEAIRQLTGDGVSLSAIARLRWLSTHRRSIVDATAHLSMICDWVLFRLTGVLVSATSAACSSGLFDIQRRQWSEALAGLAGIRSDVLPEIVEAGYIVGEVAPAVAAHLGLPKSATVVTSGADTQLAVHGSGVASSSEMVVVGGSFWQHLSVVQTPAVDPDGRLRTLCHVAPDEWLLEGVGFYSGLAYRWFRDAFVDDGLLPASSDRHGYGLMDAVAATVPIGSGGVVAVVSSLQDLRRPRRAPVSFMGFDVTSPRSSGRKECIRAILESAVFVAMGHIKLLERVAGSSFDTVRFVGGASRAGLWCQILADATGKRLRVPENPQASSVGAAIVASVAAGWYGETEQATGVIVRSGAVFEPDPQRRDMYDHLFQRWVTILEDLGG